MQKFTIHRAASGLFTDLSNALTYNQEAFAHLLAAPFSLEAFEAQIQRKTQHFNTAKRQVLVSALQKQYAGFPSAPEVDANIASLGDNNTFTVTTGHQLNLLTGPVYFIYKILHTIRLAEELTAKYPEQKFVPVYWMATEDHDFAEINHTRLFGKNISWDEEQGGPVGEYELSGWDTVKDTISAFFQNNLDSEVHAILAQYNGKNLSEATKSLVHALFSRYGLVIVEPNDKALKQEFVPVMKQEILESFAEKAVQETNAKIEEMGYKTQVFAREINLFYIQKGIRERLVLENGKINVLGLGTFSREEIAHQMEQSPEKFSPNVVLRPVYQECILPNLAYIGGGGEIAYWLQFKAAFDACNIPFPLVQVRNSLQLIDANTQKKMAKLRLETKDIFTELNELKRLYVLENSGEELDFAQLDAISIQLSNQITAQVSQVDPALQSFAAAEVVKLEKQVEGIKAKLIKQQKSRFDNAMKQLEDIHEKMFPQNGVQERKDNFFSFCADGNVFSLLENLKSAIDPEENDLIVLNLD